MSVNTNDHACPGQQPDTASARRRRSRIVRLGVLALAGLAALGVVAARQGHAAGPPSDDSGIVCTSDPAYQPGTSHTQSFVLTARTGHISAPDGNTIFMWGFGLGKGDLQYPGPTLCVNEGDTVRIVLRNTLAEDTSIVFPGQEGVKADGVAAGPQFDASHRLTSLTNVATSGGGNVTYTFTAGKPGTYLYESGSDQAKQIQMGLFGALIVRSSLDTFDSATQTWTRYAYDDARTRFDPAGEFLVLMSDVDAGLHQAVERGQPFDLAKLHQAYWMINGRSFPDTIAPNNAIWLPTQPQGALWHTQALTAGSQAPPSLVRYANVTEVGHPFHPHGNHGRVIGQDARPLVDSTGDYTYEKFAIRVGAGQTVDALYKWTDIDNWWTVTDANGTSHAGDPANPSPRPVIPAVPALENLLFKDNATWYSGSPWLGQKAALPVGVTSFNECGEFYQVAHSHALNEVTNYGAAMGGMLTLWRIDPPGGCS
jgi:FtsP/CotA-like multicopper oxidase with cupredoxin domain